jgi:MFS family permease
MRAALTDPPILALMVAQTLIWAAIFYVFPALVLHWQAEFGWSSGQVMGAFSLALAVQGLGARRFGGLIDRGLAPVSMPGGALLGAGCLLLLTQVTELWQFYALWGVMGAAMGMTLYDTAFALVMRSRDATARQAITAITLVAGFASTLAYPLTAWLTEVSGWRMAVLVLAGLVVFVNVPLARFAAARLEREGAGRAQPEATPAPEARRRPGFWPLTIGLALSMLAVGIVTSHLLPLLAALGVATASAVLAASLIGPAQVAGRIALTASGTRLPGQRLAVLAFAGMGLAAALLFGVGVLPFLVFGFAILHGMCNGLVSILRPVVVRETLGPRDFGAVQGEVVRPGLFAFAAAPFVAAVIVEIGGYLPVLALCIAAQAAGAALLLRLPSRI